MAKSVATKKYLTFVGGLNTESGPLTFPPNTWQEGDNIIPAIDGSLSKRTAVNLEGGYVLSSDSNTLSEEQVSAFIVGEWNSVAGQGSRNFLVVQRASLVYFYNNFGGNISASQKAFTVDLADYAVASGAVLGTKPIECTSAGGRLIITSNNTDPILVTYDPATDTITDEAITVEIRDLYGVDDGLAVNTRPNTLSDTHKYNLFNQGWPLAHITTYEASSGDYPSNAQVWTAGKNSTDDFTPSLLDKQDFGTTPAAKGRFVLEAFNRDRAAVSGIAGLTLEDESTRPHTCAFYAGRAWYAGVQDSTISSWVFFSQVADTSTRFGKCYQDADPTSEHTSDLVDTDGGVIVIQDAGNIVKLVPAHDSLLVLADNGVWQIKGGPDAGFSATSYEVRRLNTTPCIGPYSVVLAHDSVFFWSIDGIWEVAHNKEGRLVAQNITDTSIRSLYTSLSANARIYAQGVFHADADIIYWAVDSDPNADGNVRRFKKDKLICFDLRLRAFYTHAIGSLTTLSPYVVSLAVSKQSATSVAEHSVDVSVDAVLVGADTVVISLATITALLSRVEFLVLVPQGDTTLKATFADFETGDNLAAKWRDWYSVNNAGVAYDSFIVTGYDLGADQGGDKELQALYISVFMRRTEEGVDSAGNVLNTSSCTLQARWDWADSATSGKWSTPREVYRHRRVFLPPVPSTSFDDGYPVVVTKNKIRGRGKALHLKFTAGTSTDCQILGWSIPFLGNTNV